MQSYASYLYVLGDSNMKKHIMLWKKNYICGNFMEIIQTPAKELFEEYLLAEWSM